MKSSSLTIAIDVLCRSAVGIAGLAVSPAWPMARHLLSPYIDMDGLLESGLSLHTFLLTYRQMQALDDATVTTVILPGTIACLLVSIGFIALLSWLGGYASRRLIALTMRQALPEA